MQPQGPAGEGWSKNQKVVQVDAHTDTQHLKPSNHRQHPGGEESGGERNTKEQSLVQLSRMANPRPFQCSRA